MKSKLTLAVVVLVVLNLAALTAQTRVETVPVVSSRAANWPQFRGPNASGVSTEHGVPVEFSKTNNVVWKTNVPSGSSSPCVWGDHVFLTAFSDSTELLVLSVDARDGRIRWREEVQTYRTPQKCRFLRSARGFWR